MRQRYSPGQVCSAPNCERKPQARGLCNAHYLQAQAGKPFTAPMKRLPVGVQLPCGAPGCLRMACSRGLCSAHYQAQREGRELVALLPLGCTTEERFWAKVDKDGPTQPHMDTPCWVWTAGTRLGYGRFNVGGRAGPIVSAHRFSWELAHGPIPDAQRVLHQCDVPGCVRPEHLFLGTQADNVQDMISKGRDNKLSGDAHPWRTHPEKAPKGEQIAQSKLTEEEVRNIRDEAADGTAFAALARKYGVSSSAISEVVRRKTWKHVP